VLLAASGLVLSAPGEAAAFGTIDGGGQNREHERITRAALSCAADAPRTGECFEPRSMDYLAGHGREFGAVGAPDRDELSDPSAHCDNADFLAGAYPRTRDEANAAILACVDHMRRDFEEGVRDAQGLLNDQGQLLLSEATLESECKPAADADSRAKCASIEEFGRVLHGAQDFYAHSNWADQADPARPIADDNPPGLNLPAPSPVLDLRSGTIPSLPPDLSTGCFVVKDEIPGVGPCAMRVTHAALNKDRGLIATDSGKTSDPATPRGMVGDNFAKAVAGAIAETQRQWQDYRSALTAQYGAERGELMICTLTRDTPATDCVKNQLSLVARSLLAAGIAVAAVGAIAVVLRRSRAKQAGLR